MTSLFDTSPSDLFPASSAAESSSGYDVEAMIAQLAEAADCSLEEAAGAVARHIQKQQQQQNNAQGSAMNLRTDKERAESCDSYALGWLLMYGFPHRCRKNMLLSSV